MELDYELSQSDFREAYAIHRQRNSGLNVQVVLFWILVAIASIALYGAVKAHSMVPALAIVFLVIIWVVLIEIASRWYIARQFTKQPGAQGPRKLILDINGTHWRWNGGSADVEWKNYIRTVEGANQVLFYTAPACFNILPKRALSPEQLSDLRETLKGNIPSRK